MFYVFPLHMEGISIVVINNVVIWQIKFLYLFYNNISFNIGIISDIKRGSNL